MACGHWADEADYASAFPVRRNGEPPHVAVRHGDGPEMRMTTDEAEQFVQTVLAAVREVRPN